MTDIILSDDDEDGVVQCVVRMPDGLGPRDLEIIECPNPRKIELGKRKFIRDGKIIESSLISVRWNLRRVVSSKEDPVCMDCRQCL